MKGYTDINNTYRKLKEAYPGEEVAFCCDLGDEWLFKFVPVSSINVSGYMNGYFGIAVDKHSGKLRQYNMLKNMKVIEKKVNLKNQLKG